MLRRRHWNIQLKSYAVTDRQGTQAGDSEPGFRNTLAVNTERNNISGSDERDNHTNICFEPCGTTSIERARKSAHTVSWEMRKSSLEGDNEVSTSAATLARFQGRTNRTQCRKLRSNWAQTLTGLPVLLAPGRLVSDSLMTDYERLRAVVLDGLPVGGDAHPAHRRLANVAVVRVLAGLHKVCSLAEPPRAQFGPGPGCHRIA